MEKIEILQKFLESLIPPKKGFQENYIYSWNKAREDFIKRIKEADLEKLLHLLQ